ncbi:hypothetical protein [Oleiharenicola lentus]|uniref:hypothetical protein n=1 Tax=Oleiharenicola lentus TaxID=2508720 RepID=UPI003F668035
MFSVMADGRPFQTWLSGAVLESAAERAKAFGSESKYVRALIENDIAGKTALPSRDSLIAELARAYQPALAEIIVNEIAAIEAETGVKIDGGVVMARYLDAFAKALRDEKFHPEQSYALINEAALDTFQRVSEARMQEIATRVAELIKKTAPKPPSKSPAGLPPPETVYGTRSKRKRA